MAGQKYLYGTPKSTAQAGQHTSSFHCAWCRGNGCGSMEVGRPRRTIARTILQQPQFVLPKCKRNGSGMGGISAASVQSMASNGIIAAQRKPKRRHPICLHPGPSHKAAEDPGHCRHASQPKNKTKKRNRLWWAAQIRPQKNTSASKKPASDRRETTGRNHTSLFFGRGVNKKDIVRCQ